MSTVSKASVKAGEKPLAKIPIPVAIAAVIVLIAFAAFMGIRAFNPQSETMDLAELMTRVAKEAGPNADLSKITTEDRKQFAKVVPEHQQETLQQWIDNHKK